MKHCIPFAFGLLLSAGLLDAQAPATQTQTPAPAAEPSLAQRIKAAEPEIERLLSEYRNPEALKVMSALLPAAKPEFDGKNAKTSHESYTKYTDLAKAYYRTAQLAHAAGQWEKALDYGLKAQELSKENAEKSKEFITPVVEYYKNAIKSCNTALEQSADRIKELKELQAKRTLDPGEQQEMDLVHGVEREIVDNEKWIKFFQYDIDMAQHNVTAYDQGIEFYRTLIKDMDKSIDEYKAGRGDKGKYVEAVASYPQNLVKQYPDKKDRAAYLYRLAVLAPENKKVQREIEALISGRPAAPEKKSKR